VVILSDGWDRGRDPEVLAAEMARLHRVRGHGGRVNHVKASHGTPRCPGDGGSALPAR